MLKFFFVELLNSLAAIAFFSLWERQPLWGLARYLKLCLYLDGPCAIWSTKFVFFYGGEFLIYVNIIYYLLVVFLSILIVDTLVEGPNKDA